MQIKTDNRKMLIPGGELYETSFTLGVPENVKEPMKEKMDAPIRFDEGLVTESPNMDLVEDFCETLKGILGPAEEHPDYSLLDIGYDFQSGSYNVGIRSRNPVDLIRMQALLGDYFAKVQKTIKSEGNSQARRYHAV